MLINSRWLITCSAVCLASLAQAQSATYLEGGIVTWPWVWQDPANPGQYAVWTVEDGGRMRFARFDSSSGATPVNGWSWVSPTQPTDKILRDVSVAQDGLLGVGVGAGANWVWADDSVSGGPNGGGLWRKAQLLMPDGFSSDTQLWGVFQHPVTPEVAWVAGDGGLLAHTLDAASGVVELTACTFVQTPCAPSALPIGNLTGVQFTSDMQHGVAVGDLLTETVACPSPWNSTYVQGGIYHSFDGVTWTQANLNFLKVNGDKAVPPESMHFWKVSFVHDTHVGFAVGGANTDRGYLMVTHDGGLNWYEEHHECRGLGANQCNPVTSTCLVPSGQCETAPLTDSNGYAKSLEQYGVTAFADKSAISIAYGGQILRRDPNEPSLRRWRDVTRSCEFTTTPMWGAHSSPDGQLTIATGAPGQIRASTDGGASWTNLATEGKWRMHELALVETGGVPGEVLWTCGQFGRISVSTDRGVSFSVQRGRGVGEERMQDLQSLAVRDDGNAQLLDDVGVCVGMAWLSNAVPQWTVLYTNTGGVGSGVQACGWNDAVVFDPLYRPATGLTVAEYAGDLSGGQAVFWCAGDNSAVLRSVDSGATWTRMGPCSSLDPGCADPVSPSVSWSALAFADPDVGWIAGVDHGTGAPVVFHTLDGAAANPSWSRVLAVATALVDLESKFGETFGVDGQAGVWRWNAASGQFSPFTPSPNNASTLSEVALARNLAGAVEVIVAGGNGLLARRPLGSSQWTLPRSGSSFTPGGIAFSSSALGYVLFDQKGAAADGGSSRALSRVE